MKYSKLTQKGIGFVEIIIVLAILGIIAAVVVPSLIETKKNQVLKNAGEEILSILQRAKSQSLSSLDSSEYGVHFQSDKIVLFEGTSYSSDDPDNENILMISPVSISNINLSGGGSEVYFDRLNGTPNKTGTITISTSSHSETITILATGGASLN